jgi:alpha-glucosidase
MDSKHTSAKNVNFRNGFTGSDIGGFAEQPSGELYARWIQLGVFILCREHSSVMGIRSLGHLMKRLLILLENLLTSLPVVTTYIPCFGNILKRVPMLKPLVYYDQSDIQTHYRMTNLFWKPNFSMSILEPSIGRRMYIPRGQWYNYWTNDFVTGGRKFGLILNLTKFSCL